MKKYLAIILFVISSLIIKGQATYYDSREDFLSAMQRNKSYRTHIAAKDITSVQTFGYKKNNPDGVLMSASKYDGRGNNTDFVKYSHGKIKTHNTATYDDSSRMMSYTHYKRNGKLKEMGNTIYDKSGNIIEIDFYKKNPQSIFTKTVKIYNNSNNITESKVLDKNGKLKNRIGYTYYDDGTKKQTIQYSGSGKIMRIWNFDCNPVGKLEAKKFKDTSKVCIHFETDKDGNPIKVKEEYTGAGFLGRTIRNVTKYDKNNNMIDATYYNLNGKELGHWNASYNASNQITEYAIYKAGTRQTWFKTTYSYNDAGNIAESVIYKKSQAPVSKMKYVYTSSLSLPAK